MMMGLILTVMKKGTWQVRNLRNSACCRTYISSFKVLAGYGDRDFSSESEEDDSDEFTLDTSVRKKKGPRVNSKTGVASKNRKRSCKERERSFVRAKRMKRVPADSYRNDSELGSKRHLRKNRTDEVDLQVMKKHKKSLPEIIMHGSTSVSQKVSPSSLRPEENRAETCSFYSFHPHAKKDYANIEIHTKTYVSNTQ